LEITDAAVIPFNSPRKDDNRAGRPSTGPYPLMCIDGSSRCSTLPVETYHAWEALPSFMEESLEPYRGNLVV